MKRALLWVQLVLAAVHYPLCAWAAGPACPIEEVVGLIQQIKGDLRFVHLYRKGQEVPAASQSCLLYGDKLKVGLEATVTLDTTQGLLHVGGNYDPEWAASQARDVDPPTVSAFFNALLPGVMTQPQSVYAVSRDNEACPTLRGLMPPLTPLDRLREMNQEIGTDLSAIVAAWTRPLVPHDVQGRLVGADGQPIVQNHACLDSHMVLQLPAGILHGGDRLALEIGDPDRGGLRYNLTVVDPAELPRPSVKFLKEWELGAWRIAAAPPEFRLDGIARAYTAPSDSLGAKRILEAVWSGAPF